MAFQQARTRPPLRTHALLEPSQAGPIQPSARASASASEADGGAVVIITAGPPRSGQARQSRPAPPSPTEIATTECLPSPLSTEWTVLNLRDHPASSPRQTDRSLSFSSSSAASAGTGAGLSPALFGPGQGLLPQHDGGGRFFRHEGVVHSDSNTSGGVGTSESEGEGGLAGGRPGGAGVYPARPRSRWAQREASFDSARWSPQMASSPSLLLAPATRPTGHLPISHWAAQSLTQSAASTALGSSWALTEAALASVPDARRPDGGLQLFLGRSADKADSAVLTDDDGSTDELGAGSREEEARSLDGDEDDEPMAASAGLSGALRRARSTRREQAGDNLASGRSWAGSYPSPPPETARSALGPTVTKRRHRHAGKAGSQKRSSTAGSVRGAFSDPGKTARLRHRSEADGSVAAEPAASRASAVQVRSAPATPLFLGSALARLTRADPDTLALFSDADGDSYLGLTPYSASPTPTQSRAPSPSLVAHGLARLSRYAQDELDDLAPAFHVRDVHSVDKIQEQDADSGAETETEGDRAGPKWVRSFRPPSPALTDEGAGALARSFSARSLPAYLGEAGGLNSMTSLGLKGARRLVDEAEGGADAGSSPWGGEFEGREAALSYWRRLLRQLRGF